MKSTYEIVTEKVIKLLEQGTVPWHCTWKPGQKPTDFVSGKPYKGINRFLLSILGYQSPYWLTLRQVNNLGGRIRGGERSVRHISRHETICQKHWLSVLSMK